EAVAGAHRRTEGGRSQRVRTVRAALETELASRLTNGERDGHVRSHVLLARLDGRRGGLCGERRCAVVPDRRRGGALLVDSRDLTEGEAARVGDRLRAGARILDRLLEGAAIQRV